MPPENRDFDDPGVWLRYARADLTMAERAPNFELREEIASFHIQQCAEKAIKAVLKFHGKASPYTHDITRLFELRSAAGIAYPESLNEATALTGYAVHSRYPTLGEAIEPEEFKASLGIARAVLAWAEEVVTEPEPKS